MNPISQSYSNKQRFVTAPHLLAFLLTVDFIVQRLFLQVYFVEKYAGHQTAKHVKKFRQTSYSCTYEVMGIILKKHEKNKSNVNAIVTAMDDKHTIFMIFSTCYFA